MKRVIIGCEFSGVVRRAFAAKGWFAVSCDLLEAEDGAPFGVADYSIGWHYRGNIMDLIYGDAALFMENGGFDLGIFHPDCTFLCNSGVRWLYKDGRKQNGIDQARWKNMDKAARFYNRICKMPIKRICVENPIQHEHAMARIKALGTVQFVQPWQFGHKEMKATGLRLINLPPLKPTKIVGPPPKDPAERHKWARVHQASPSPDRWKERSRTLPGIAAAMAEQWGSL